MKFTKLSETAFQELQLNAGVLLKSFSPETGAVDEGDILGATTGGVSFSAVPSFQDMGEDMDNCPKNMMELKRLDTWEVKMSGTYVTVNPAQVRSLLGAADVDADAAQIAPRNDLRAEDFSQLWWVGDYSDQNGAKNGGFVAICMSNALSTGGFQIKSGDRAKGQFAFEYTAHYSLQDQDAVPFSVYVRAGTAEV